MDEYKAKGEAVLKRLLASGDMGRAQQLLAMLAKKEPIPNW